MSQREHVGLHCGQKQAEDPFARTWHEPIPQHVRFVHESSVAPHVSPVYPGPQMHFPLSVSQVLSFWHARSFIQRVQRWLGFPFLPSTSFPSNPFLNTPPPIYRITTRATIKIAGIGNFFLALVTIRTSIAHACAFADFTSALVRTGAVRQHYHQQSSPPDKFSSRQAGRFAVLGVHLEMTSP
ncbi:hypothetical protein PsorP6_002671 [Peronosclerospora sorghi]|uniref:Uncharacterized protein n=1 Tax=Peronosclerospora sorghi TaxID=230839 RepID=A0ACC0WRL9_9STRA|nr:hypothetical protein PsorP6_002671 [Peronosclerospora sorghi]